MVLSIQVIGNIWNLHPKVTWKFEHSNFRSDAINANQSNGICQAVEVFIGTRVAANGENCHYWWRTAQTSSGTGCRRWGRCSCRNRSKLRRGKRRSIQNWSHGGNNRIRCYCWQLECRSEWLLPFVLIQPEDRPNQADGKYRKKC